MKIHLRSDIHLKVNRGVEQPPFPQDVDVWVIAGDIEDHKYPAQLAYENPDKHVIVVLGNHDYWYCDGPDDYRDPEVPNLHVLEKETVRIADHVFLGCTLWGRGPDTQEDSFLMLRSLNDFRNVPGLTPFTMRDWNRESIAWLVDTANKIDDRLHVVIVTHFPPMDRSGSEDRLTSLYYNGGVDLNAFKSFDFWLFGHTHDNQFDPEWPMTNALGYMKYESCSEFDPLFVITSED